MRVNFLAFFLLALFANCQKGGEMLLASYEQYSNEVGATPIDPTPLNLNPEADPVASAHRFGANEADAVVWEAGAGFLPISATATSVADVSNGYGNYVMELEATATTGARSRHYIDTDIVQGKTYHVYFLYRMTQGIQGRIQTYYNSNDQNFANLSATDWTVIEFDLTTDTGAYMEIDVFASSGGVIGDKIQYKLQVKEVDYADKFINAVATLTVAEETAITNLVDGLLINGTWDKYKAIYPFVGGTAAEHKWNLKDPRDLDAAHRLEYYGTVTHDAQGVTGDGSTGYIDANYIPSVSGALEDEGLHLYINSNATPLRSDAIEIGAFNSATQATYFGPKQTSSSAPNFTSRFNSDYINLERDATGDNTITANGYWSVNRDAGIVVDIYKNGSSWAQVANGGTPILSTNTTYILNTTVNGGVQGAPYSNGYSNQTIAFAGIGVGLTAQEVADDYVVIEAYQVELSRNNSPAQDFIAAVGTLTTAEETAITNLVDGLVANGTWTKYKAIYPFVGGTAAEHKWNLKDPRDLDAAHRITWNLTGIVHDENGVKFDGSTGHYGETHYVPNDNVTLNSETILIYSNSDETPLTTDPIEVGAYNSSSQASFLSIKRGNTIRSRFNSDVITIANTDARGFFAVGKNGTTDARLFKDGVNLTNATIAGSLPTSTTHIGKLNLAAYSNGFSNQRLAFVGLADGLSDTEVANDYAVIDAYQVELSRNNSPAQDFIAAVGTLTTAEETAIINLYDGLVTDGLWDKLDVIYPFVGGTAAEHKWNLKDAQDTDAAFRAEFYSEGTGSVVHDANGVTLNSPVVEDGGVIWSNYETTDIGADDSDFRTSISMYSPDNLTAVTRGGLYTGFWSGEGAAAIQFSPYNNAVLTGSNTPFYARIGGSAFNSANTTFDDIVTGQGFFTISTSGTLATKVFHNGLNINGSPYTTTARVSNTANNKGIAFGTIHNGAVNPTDASSFYGLEYQTGTYSFISIGNVDLDDTDATNLFSRVEAYQKELGRSYDLYPTGNAASIGLGEANATTGAIDNSRGSWSSVTTTPSPQNGSHSLKFTRNAVTGGSSNLITLAGVTTGVPLDLTFYLYEGTSLAQAQVYLQVSNGWDAEYDVSSFTTGSWTLVTFTGIQATSSTPSINVYNGSGATSGDWIAVDNITLVEQ